MHDWEVTSVCCKCSPVNRQEKVIIVPQHDKTNKMACATTDDSDQPGYPPSLISLRSIGSSAAHWGHCENSDQTGRMPRLIWVFTGSPYHFVVFFMRWLNFFFFLPFWLIAWKKLKWKSTLYFFSLPEPKGHRWAYSVGRHLSSAVVTHTLRTSSPQKLLSNQSQISYGASLGWGNESFVQTILVTGPRIDWSISVKLGIQHRALEYYHICYMVTLHWPLNILQKGQLQFITHLYRKRLKWWITQKLWKCMV